MVNITHVDLLRLATSFDYAYSLEAIANASTNQIGIISYHPSFDTEVLGNNVSQRLVSTQEFDAFHEAGVYNQATGKIYATSNWAGDFSNPINVTVIDPNSDAVSFTHYANLAEANGAHAFYPVGTAPNSNEGQQIVFCDEGDLQRGPSQLVLVDPAKNTSKVILNNFLGRNFSSLNDIIQHPKTGDLWFTDARYGYWQYFDPEPSIRPQVYRFEPNTGIVQAVADYFIAPNGIEISYDWKYIYVTDTGVHTFPGKDNATGPATIYRYEFSEDGKRLRDRQVFAYSDRGFPDGIHSDTLGNVYSATSDGVHVWNPSGVLIGKFTVGGNGSNNFIFVPGGMYIFNAFKLWKVTFKAEGRTVKRDFGL